MYNKRLSLKKQVYNWTSVIFPSNFLESLASVARRATQHSCPQCCHIDHTSSPCLARWLQSLLWDKLDFHRFQCVSVSWCFFLFLYFNLKCAFIWNYSAFSASHFGSSVGAKVVFVVRSKRQAFSNWRVTLTIRPLYLRRSSLRFHVSKRPSGTQTGCGRTAEKNSHSECWEHSAGLVTVLNIRIVCYGRFGVRSS